MAFWKNETIVIGARILIREKNKFFKFFIFLTFFFEYFIDYREDWKNKKRFATNCNIEDQWTTSITPGAIRSTLRKQWLVMEAVLLQWIRRNVTNESRIIYWIMEWKERFRNGPMNGFNTESKYLTWIYEEAMCLQRACLIRKDDLRSQHCSRLFFLVSSLMHG